MLWLPNEMNTKTARDASEQPGLLESANESTMSLLERVRNGEADALEQLVARCLPRLQQWARGRLPKDARALFDTQDLVQDTLLSALRRLDQFEVRGEGALQAYLRQILLNRVRDQIRRRNRRGQQVELESGIPSPDDPPLEQAIGRAALIRYEQALDELKPADREAIILRLEFGYSYDELMTALDKPSIGATRKTVERAIMRLAEEMQRRHEAAGDRSPGQG